MGILFYDESTSGFNLPTTILSEDDKSLLARKGLEPKPIASKTYYYPLELEGNYYRNVPIIDFPSIYYSDRPVPIYDTTIPLYVLAFLERPKGFTKRYFTNSGPRLTSTEYKTEIQKDLKAAHELWEDLRHFPLEPFYEKLWALRDIPITIDYKHSGRAFTTFDPLQVIFGSNLQQHYFDPAWVGVSLLHELYHLVEFGLDNTASLISNQKRWKLLKVKDAWNDRRYGKLSSELLREAQERPFHALNVQILQWSNRQIKINLGHLAETLAMLTWMRYPEVKEKIEPYCRSLEELISPPLTFYQPRSAT